jgi:DNA modification methylase
MSEELPQQAQAQAQAQVVSQTVETGVLTTDPRAFIVELSLVKVQKDRGRKEFKGLKELGESIKTFGLIHALVVKRSAESEGSFDLVSGERRLRAMVLIGLTSAPCVLRDDLSEVESKEVELEENLRRSDLSWMETSALMAQIHDLKVARFGEVGRGGTAGGKNVEGWRQSDTASLIGVSNRTVSRQIDLAKQLEKRPDLKAVVEKLPMNVAIKVIKQKLEEEKLEGLQAMGLIEMSTELREGNAVEMLKTLDAESIDLWLTDPPFGNEEISKMRGVPRGTSRGSVVQSYTTTLKEADNLTRVEAVKLLREIARETFRVLKPSRHLYVFFTMECYEEFMVALRDAGFEVDNVPLIWDKGRSTTPARGYNYTACYEPVLYGWKPPKNRRLHSSSRSILSFDALGVHEKIHPFQKPPALLEFLIEQSTSKSEVVLDTCAGSGATLIAARRKGRRALGFELDHEHCARAQSALRSLETPQEEEEEEE